MKKEAQIQKIVEEHFFGSWAVIAMILDDMFGPEGVQAGKAYFEALQEEIA